MTTAASPKTSTTTSCRGDTWPVTARRNVSNRSHTTYEPSIQERFEFFHQSNPHVYDTLRRISIAMARRGVKRFGMKGLFEVLRWKYAIQTQDADFKLNNDYTADYARKLMDENPELRGFFEVRRRRTMS